MRKMILIFGMIGIIYSTKAQVLVASYPFSGNANDIVGTANGTVNGPTLTTDRFGNADKAYSFDGTTQNISGFASSFPTGDRTVSLWFKADVGSIATTPGVFSYGGGGICGSSFLMIINNGGNSAFQTQGHCNSNLNEAQYATSPENGWFHWVVTVSGSTSKIYINGELRNISTTFLTPTNVTAKDFCIGGVINSNGVGSYSNHPLVSYFKGKIDDLKIYDGALTDEQVAAEFGGVITSLVASYPFNGNANDAVGNSDGTVNGATLTTDRFGNSNSAYSFDGSSNWIEAPADNLPTANSTVSIWFNADIGSLVSNRPGILGYGGNSTASCPGNSYLLVLNLFGNLGVFTQAHCNSNLASFNYISPPENNWYQLVTTRNGNIIKIYLNGALVATSNTGDRVVLVAGKKLSIGAIVGLTGLANYTDPNVGRFKGKLDDLKIYNGALTDAQIFDEYLNELKRPGSGNAIAFDSNLKQFIEVGKGFDQLGSFSFETWVKRSNTNKTDLNSQTFMASQQNNGWSIGINQSNPINKIYISRVGINQVLSTSEITDTKWHHVAVTYNSITNKVVFYIDGVADNPVNYSPGGFDSGNTNYRIAGRNNGVNFENNLNGVLDEIRVWNSIVLSQTEVRDWMCRKITSDHPRFNNLQGYFRLDEGTGLVSGGYNSKFGTLMNVPIWQTSGAAIGDTSAYDYTNSIKKVKLSSLSGEYLEATSTNGNPLGLQIYGINEQPNSQLGANGIGVNNKYFGVYQIGGISPQYTAVYKYLGNTLYNLNTQSSLGLYNRTDNQILGWLPTAINLNQIAKTITTGPLQNNEFILAIMPCPNAISVTDSITANQKAAFSLSTIFGNSMDGNLNIIPGGANVVYQAGKEILLNPGFTTNSSSVFQARILSGCQ